jgi:streptogramin lyase
MTQLNRFDQTQFGKQMLDVARSCRIPFVFAAFAVAVFLTLGMALPAQAEDEVVDAAIFGQVNLEAPPQNVYVESTGRVWYTLPSADKLALVTSGGVIYYPVDGDTVNNSRPYDLVVNGGAVWFTMFGSNKIGKLTIANGRVDSYNIPTNDTQPTGITAGGGAIWFVERKGDKLGRVNPANGAIQEFYDWLDDTAVNGVNMRGAELEDVVYLNGDVWFVGPKLKSSVALYRERNARWIASPAGPGAAPMQIAVDSLDNVYVTFNGFNMIGRSAINTLSNWEPYFLPTGGAGPVGLSVREAKGITELWYTRPEANRVGRLQVRSGNGIDVANWETRMPNAKSAPWGIAADSNGSGWIAPTGVAKSVSWNSPYYPFFLRMPLLQCAPEVCTQD